MIRNINIKEEVIFNISEVADLSYAWQTIESYSSRSCRGLGRIICPLVEECAMPLLQLLVS